MAWESSLRALPMLGTGSGVDGLSQRPVVRAYRTMCAHLDEAC